MEIGVPAVDQLIPACQNLPLWVKTSLNDTRRLSNSQMAPPQKLYDLYKERNGTHSVLFTFELVRHCSQAPWSQNFSFLPSHLVSCATYISFTDHLIRKILQMSKSRSKEQLAQLAHELSWIIMNYHELELSTWAHTCQIFDSFCQIGLVCAGVSCLHERVRYGTLNLLDLCSLQQFFQPANWENYRILQGDTLWKAGIWLYLGLVSRTGTHVEVTPWSKRKARGNMDYGESLRVRVCKDCVGLLSEATSSQTTARAPAYRQLWTVRAPATSLLGHALPLRGRRGHRLGLTKLNASGRGERGGEGCKKGRRKRFLSKETL